MDTNFIKHDMHDNDWIGVVVNNQDPTFSGRAQVRVFGVMEGIIDEHIPWATPTNSEVFGLDGGGSMSVPKIGTFVRIQFNNGDIYAPEILSVQNLDTDLIDKIKKDYNDGCHVILHDPVENLSILHLRESGLVIKKADSFIQITPDSMITIEHADTDSVIQLIGDKIEISTKNEVNIHAAAKATVTADEVIVAGSQRTKIGPGPTYEYAILAGGLWAILDTLAIAIDAKTPPTPGITQGMLEALKAQAQSMNVKISKF